MRNIVVVAVILQASVALADASKMPLADCHVHLVDFLQNGDHLEKGKRRSISRDEENSSISS